VTAILAELRKQYDSLTPAEISRRYSPRGPSVLDPESGINIALPVGRAMPSAAGLILDDEKAYARIVALRKKYGIPPIPREVDEAPAYIM